MLWPTAAENYLPPGWLPCDGRTLKHDQYGEIFSVIGYDFGGSRGSFALPDLRGRAPLGAEGGGSLKLGTSGGADMVLQSMPVPLPIHTHDATFTPGALSPKVPLRIEVDDSSTGGYVTDSTKSMLAVAVTSSGGSVVGYAPPAQATPGAFLNGLQGEGDGISGGKVEVGPAGSHSQMDIELDTRQPYLALNYLICVKGGNYPAEN